MPAERAFDRRVDLNYIERFLEVIADARANTLGGALDRSAAGNDDDFYLRELGLHRSHQFLAVHPRHVQVQCHQIEAFAAEALQGFGATGRLNHAVFRLEDHSHRFARSALIVDDQDSGNTLVHLSPSGGPLTQVVCQLRVNWQIIS